MDEQQFAQRLLALLQRNPNVNLAEYFRNEPAFQEFVRITQFRHYRADEQEQILKLLIPVLIEQIGIASPGLVEIISNACPSLIASKELFVPALIQKTQAEYGAIAVLFAQFRFVTEFPTELCRCVRYQPLQNGCALTCNGDGAFETAEQCAQFRANASSGMINRYYATRQNNEWVALRSSTSLTEIAPSVNLFVAKSGFIPMIRQENVLVNGNYVSKWVGQNGGYYDEKDIDLYYVGAEFWRPNGIVQLELTGYGWLSPNGNNFNQADFRSVQASYPQNPIPLFELQNCQTFTIPNNRISTVSSPRGILKGFATVSTPVSPPSFPASTTVSPNNEGKYTILQLYLGGDRETPLLLGEFLIRTGLLASNIWGINLSDTALLYNGQLSSQSEPYYIYQKWLADEKYFLPEWMSTQQSNGQRFAKVSTTDDNKKAILSTFTNIDQFNLANFKCHLVKLSETESEICIKYQTFKQVKGIRVEGSSSYVEYNIIWCEIIIIKVNRGSVSKKTYKYPEEVVTDPRNWTSPWCKNWEHTGDKGDFSYLDVASIWRSGNFWQHQNVNNSFPGKFELSSYLEGNLAALHQRWGDQSPEIYNFPVNSKSCCAKGVNFISFNNKLYSLDAKVNQSFKVTKNNKQYTVLLPEIIKHQTTEVMVRFGEPEKIDYNNNYFASNGNLKDFKYEFFGNRTLWQLKGVPKVFKSKVYKIPSDSIIFEISAGIDPIKFEASTLAFNPQIYETEFSYYYEGIVMIKIADVSFLDSNNRLNPETSEQAISENTSMFGYLGSMVLRAKYNTPYSLTRCNEPNYTFPSAYEDYYSIRKPPIIKGYCE